MYFLKNINGFYHIDESVLISCRPCRRINFKAENQLNSVKISKGNIHSSLIHWTWRFIIQIAFKLAEGSLCSPPSRHFEVDCKKPCIKVIISSVRPSVCLPFACEVKSYSAYLMEASCCKVPFQHIASKKLNVTKDKLFLIF